jgi:hypothetical protein
MSAVPLGELADAPVVNAGFVERLQGTILHEHWRVEFRRRYFTQLTQLQHSLEGFLRFYNHERPHHGSPMRHRTR